MVKQGAKQVPAKAGTALHAGDKVEARGGSATLFFLKGPQRKVSGRSSLIVNSSGNSGGSSLIRGAYVGLSQGFASGGNRVAATMREGAIEPLSPVDTAVLDNKEAFKWTLGGLDKASVVEYEVAVFNGQEVVARARTRNTSLPLASLTLPYDVPLHWHVTPYGQIDKNAPQPIDVWQSREANFTLASPAKANEVRLGLNQIQKNTSLSPENRQLMGAAFLGGRGFYDRALQELEGTKNPGAKGLRTAFLPPATRKKKLEDEALDPNIYAKEVVTENSLKTYTDPYGNFSVRIPITWGYGVVTYGSHIRQTNWQLRPISSPRMSITIAPSVKAGQKPLIERIFAKARQVKIYTATKAPEQVQWNNKTVLRQNWKVKQGPLLLNGTAWSWTEKGKDIVAMTGWTPGDEKQAALLAPCLASIRVNDGPGRKIPLKNPWDRVTSKALLTEMKAIVAQQTLMDMQGSTMVLEQSRIKGTLEEFNRLNAARMRTRPGTLDRAKATNKAAVCASEMGWKAISSSRPAEARRWFARHTALKLEAYEAYIAEIRARLALNEAKIDNLRRATPPIEIADSVGTLLDIRLALQQTFATQGSVPVYNRNDAKEMEFLARLGWSIARDRIALMALSGTYTAPLTSMKAYAKSQASFHEYRRMNRRVDAADALAAMCDAAMARANWPLAQKFAQSSLAWRRALPATQLKKNESLAQRKLALIADKSGDYVVARARYEELWRKLQTESSNRQAEIAYYTEPTQRVLYRLAWLQDRVLALNNLGIVLSNLSDFAGARAKYEQALTLMKTEGEKLEADMAQVKAGQSAKTDSAPQPPAQRFVAPGVKALPPTAIAEFMGDSGEERLLFFRAQLKATVLGNLAVLESNEGNLDQAAKGFEQVYKILRVLGQDRDAALAQYNSTGVFFEKQDYASAIKTMQTSREIFLQLQDTKYLPAVTYSLARLEGMVGREAQAEKLAVEALQLSRVSNNADDIANAANMLASSRIERWFKTPKAAQNPKVLDNVEGLLKEANTYAVRAGRSDTIRSILLTRARLQEARGDLNGALVSLKAALARIEAIRANNSFGSLDSYLNLAAISDTYERTVKMQLRLGLNADAFDTLSRARSKRLFDSLRLANLESPNPALQQLLDKAARLEGKQTQLRSQLQEEAAQPDETRDPVKIENLRNQLAATQAEFFAVSAKITEQHPGFEKALAVNPVMLKKAQSSIPAGALLLQYAPLGEQIYIFAVTRTSLKIYTSPVSAEALGKQVAKLRDSFNATEKLMIQGSLPPAPEGDKEFLAASTELYQSLVAPVASEWQKAKIVAIIPTSELYYLPFHALAHQTPAGLKFWIEETPITYLMGADVLSVMKPRTTKPKGSVLAMGDPTGANLPAAREEVTAVARLFPASEALVGDRASKAVILNAKGLQKRALHLAAHGVLNPLRPDRSFIQLAPNLAKHDDGKLRVSEIYGLNLDGVDLVTLSACQTALGNTPTNGSEITSLAESFSSAGTPSVVASLWNVEDTSTRSLMEKFYGALADGKPKGQALREAQVALLKNPQTRHPFFWAPFELLGDWR